VHFHEVGAIDSIIDVIGACVALEFLGKPRLFAGPVVEGTGTIQCAHGCFPLPAPATLEILSARGVPVVQCEEPNELVTPTGAAILAELAESFGPMQNVVPEKIGYGLGSRENKTRPNVVRAVSGKVASAAAHDWEIDTVTVLETNIDDLNPEILGAFMEKALQAGALDVFHTAIQMKKSRPGVMISVLCEGKDADALSELMLRETSAFGVRRFSAERRKLKREFVKVKTVYGEVTVKLGRLDGQVLQAETLQEMYLPQAGTTNFSSYGLGYMVQKILFTDLMEVYHTGTNLPGWCAVVATVPEKGEGLVLMTNASGGAALRHQIHSAWLGWVTGSSTLALRTEKLGNLLLYILPIGFIGGVVLLIASKVTKGKGKSKTPRQ
jgi:hypothetical protein